MYFPAIYVNVPRGEVNTGLEISQLANSLKKPSLATRKMSHTFDKTHRICFTWCILL